MAIRSKRKEIDEQKVYCRKCQEHKKKSDFFICTDEYLDTNGVMSICKTCCNLIYNNIYNAEKNISKSLLRCCRMLNVRFDEDAVEATKAHLNTLAQSGKETSNVFGIYKGKILSSAKKNFSDKNSTLDLTFYEPVGLNINPEDPLEDHEKNAEELKRFWGDNLEYDDYAWLESELAEWKQTHSAVTKSEVSLLKMIILKSFDIRKARKENNVTAINKLEESYQNLLKTSALSPAQSNAASQGKLADTYGMLIKMIEEETPAEHYKYYELFGNFFNLKKYFKDYISRPITNFFNGQKNYQISEDGDVSLDDNTEIDIPLTNVTPEDNSESE
jgi:hypothetical protein